MKNYTKTRIQALIEKYDRTLTLEDVESIIELDRIAGRIEKGIENVEKRDYFKIGERYFMRPSFARFALIQKIEETFSMDVWVLLGTLWALDMERAEKELKTPPKWPTLIRYAFKLDVPISAVSKIVEKELYQSNEDASGNEADKDFSAWKLCAILAREAGGSPDEWFNANPEKIEGAVKAIEERIEAEAKVMGGGSKHAPQPSPLLYAVRDFRIKAEALEKSWQE
jgi:hypothetical protein